MSRGRFVCVVGPSGAGKDTLIDLARGALQSDRRIQFVRRLITRPPSPGEDHEPIDEDEFAERERAGAFAIAWRAHGLGYGIPAAAIEAVGSGAVLVCNMSRAAVPDARRLFATSVVLVTAPPETCAERISGRGRETPSEALERLTRQVEPISPSDCDLVINNTDAPEVGAASLTAFLKTLAAGVRDAAQPSAGSGISTGAPSSAAS